MLNAWRYAAELSAEVKKIQGRKLSFIERHPWLCDYILVIETIIALVAFVIYAINK